MKEEEYYYLDPSCAVSGLTTLAGKLVEIAKREYAGAVVSESGLNRIKDSLIFNAEALKKEHPRWRLPNIVVYYNDFTKSMHLNVDGWSFIGHRVTGFIH